MVGVAVTTCTCSTSEFLQERERDSFFAKPKSAETKPATIRNQNDDDHDDEIEELQIVAIPPRPSTA